MRRTHCSNWTSVCPEYTQMNRLFYIMITTLLVMVKNAFHLAYIRLKCGSSWLMQWAGPLQQFVSTGPLEAVDKGIIPKAGLRSTLIHFLSFNIEE